MNAVWKTHYARNGKFFNTGFAKMDSLCVDLRTLAAAVGGDISSGQVLCPGPNHSKRDRSLAIRPTASGGFVCHSFAGDDWQSCRDYVYERLGLPRYREQSHSPPPLKRTAPRDVPPQNVERAKSLWAEGQDPRGTPAEGYLASRKLEVRGDLAGTVLRYHPDCPWRINDTVCFIPCLLASFTSIANNEVTAIHRIRLDQPERWPKTERMMLGETRWSAIQLDPPGQRLCVAEGVESALAARQLGFDPVWSLGSARRFLPIEGVEELIILGEHDAASRRAADVCAGLWSELGKKVVLALPRNGGDFNDYLMERRR